jgi:hypothetical protein
MPVLYVAVGRRLGYPLKLVGAKGHLFFRWEDGKERRNFECTNGVSCPDDDHYKKWPFPIGDEEVQRGWYLRSLTPREELAGFLQTRASVLRYHGRATEALLAQTQAVLLQPGHPDLQMGLAIAMGQQSASFASSGGSPVLAPNFLAMPNDPMADIRQVEAINAANAARSASAVPPPAAFRRP